MDMKAFNLELHYLSPEISKDLSEHNPVVTVFGVGGGGGNAIQHMIENGIEGVEYIYMDTDRQKLKEMNVLASTKIDQRIAHGLSVKTDFNMIKKMAMNGRKHIQASIEGSHILFVVAGVGGEEGLGLAQAVAQIAHEMDILTIALINKPIGTGSDEYMEMSEHAIDEIAQYVDSIISIPLKILTPTPESQANDISYKAVKGIAELITCPNLVGIDFSDVKAVMSGMGKVVTGSGQATGESRVKKAILTAISSPLLGNISLDQAQGAIVNITVGPTFANDQQFMDDFNEASTTVLALFSEDALVVIGYDTDLQIQPSDQLRITLVVTGLDQERDTEATIRH